MNPSTACIRGNTHLNWIFFKILHKNRHSRFLIINYFNFDCLRRFFWRVLICQKKGKRYYCQILNKAQLKDHPLSRSLSTMLHWMGLFSIALEDNLHLVLEHDSVRYHPETIWLCHQTVRRGRVWKRVLFKSERLLLKTS